MNLRIGHTHISIRRYYGTKVYHKDEDYSISLVGKIAIRMGWESGSRSPFAFLGAQRIHDDRYIIFVIHEETPVTIEDNNLFPSDELITKLRLLAG